MAWTIDYSRMARSQLQKLDRNAARRIVEYMDARVATSDNPRNTGRALTGPLRGLWRYRVGDYRVVCDIQDEVLHILVVRIGRRDEVYR